MKKYDIVCVGFAVGDIVLDGIREDALQRDSTHALRSLAAAGGDAVNQAAVLASLGNQTALVAGFGRDSVGLQIEADLVKRGVDVTWSKRENIKKTGFSVVVIKEGGERSFLVAAGEGDTDVGIEDISEDLLERTRAISIGSLFYLKKLDGGGAAELFRRASDKGVFTFADMTADAYGIGPEGIREIYPYTDYLLPSMEEAVYVTGKSDMDEIADYFLERGVKNLILKLGEKGCFVKNQEERFFVNAYKIETVDTTGCGDAFCAGFISGILAGMTLKESAEYGCAAGAFNAKTLGAHEGIKNKEQLYEFMQRKRKL